jgi:hypothetical protein
MQPHSKQSEVTHGQVEPTRWKASLQNELFETYALGVTWFAIRLIIIFGIIFCWALQQVDFVMAYPQAPIKMDIYMELPQGIQTKHGNSKEHVLKLEKNIYGQKEAGRMWNSFLVDKLTSIRFTTSLIDDCIFFRGDIIFIVYVTIVSS